MEDLEKIERVDLSDIIEQSQERNQQRRDKMEMYYEAHGWDIFDESVASFLYDFFKHDLNGYEKLLFYKYYIDGNTLDEIGQMADVSLQHIGKEIKKIEKKLSSRWKNKKNWTIK